MDPYVQIAKKLSEPKRSLKPPRRVVILRLEEPIAVSLISSAEALKTSINRLANNLLETSLEQFVPALQEVRPDLATTSMDGKMVESGQEPELIPSFPFCAPSFVRSVRDQFSYPGCRFPDADKLPEEEQEDD